MKSLSKLFFLVLLVFLSTTSVQAQEAFPKIKFPCDQVNDPEFHSLRPYQAAVCGDADKALFCSNDLKFIESFDLTNQCDLGGNTSDFWCKPKNGHINPHNLYVELTDSMFPIMGNTEQVKNSQEGTEEFSDAQKVNEYASWYLSGVNNKAEYGENTEDRVVNFSGPIQKLLPKLIQEAERIDTIKKAIVNEPYVDEDTGETITEPQNHNQIVVCAESNLGIIGDITGLGSFKPVECYDGNKSKANGKIFRLVRDKGGFVGASDPKDCSYVCRVPESVECKRCLGEGLQPIVGGADSWEGDLSIWNNFINNIVGKIVDLLPLVPQEAIKESVLNHWNKRIPPLPWENDPFQNRPMTELEYKKYYNEWRGKTCVIIPLINSLFCFDNILVPNKYADLYQYIPLSNTTDKKGAENILGVQIEASTGTTKIANDGYNVGGQKNAPLYFAHTEEVKELSNLLNKTYTPANYESEPLPKTTEKNVCSAVNVRTNKGDNLFPGDRSPGDKKEIIIPGVTYDITQVLCKVTKKEVCVPLPKPPGGCVDTIIYTHQCNAEVTITVKTNTKTPNADEIFSTTVADSGSTFRKIFPKVEAGAPVNCIADIPAVTSVTYNADESEVPRGGSLEFKVKEIPEDSAGNNPELTFPHIGSVYEYFLKGIQTALRPKGYGEPITDGALCTSNAVCGEWESKLVNNSGACGVCNTDLGPLAQKILASAGAAYGVPAANIYAAMKHEGVDWPAFQGKFANDDDVRKWSNGVSCGGEEMPGCDNSIETTQPPFGFLSHWFYLGDGNNAIWSAVQKIDPTRDSKDKVSRCNFLDAAFAAAKSLRQGSSNTTATTSCGQYSFDTTQPSSCSDWTDTKIAQSQVGYMGQCPETSPYGPVPFTIADVVNWEHSYQCQ